MKYEKFISPREIEIDDTVYTVSQIDAVDAIPIQSAVAESVAANGMVGLVMLQPDIAKKILSFTAVMDGSDWFELDTDVKINHYLSDKKRHFSQLVIEMVKENFGFLIDGTLLGLLAGEERKETASVS